MIQVFNIENNHATNKKVNIFCLQTKKCGKIVYKRES